MDIHLEGVEIEGKGVYFHLEGVYSNIYMYICIYIYIHTYIHTSTYIYTYIYIYIYYYTPLPLNLANNNNKQATTRLRAVLAIAPSQRFGSCPYVAILEPRWWPCQIQVLSQKLTGDGPGRWRQVGRCPPKPAQFLAKTALVRVQNSQTKANGCYIPHAA